MTNDPGTPARLRLWGALDSTVDHVLGAYYSQMERNGCPTRPRDDLERFAALGLTALRYPLPWDRIAPHGLGHADWSWPDRRLPALKRLGIAPIVGLVQNGALPRHVSLCGRDFGWQLAQYAAAVARRYPWLELYTPVCAPQLTARFVAADHMGPVRGHDPCLFARAVVSQCRAVVLAMRAVRTINPRAKLVQVEELGKAWGTPPMAPLAELHNELRWLTWDLLGGRVDRHHPLWNHLLEAGVGPAELLWFCDHPCRSDLLGIRHDADSLRWFDHRTERYPQRCLRSIDGEVHADIEALRVLATPAPGIGPLLCEAWERYRLPLAVAEARIDTHREDQLRWLREVWDGATAAATRGADVRAVTVYPLLGAYDWHSMAAQHRGVYEAGAFAVRGGRMRPTALARTVDQLATGQPLSSPVLQADGWWHGGGRFVSQPVASNAVAADLDAHRRRRGREHPQPILVAGAYGRLGSAFGLICEKRNLACELLSRQDMDAADPAAVAAAIERYRPWAVINAAGQACPDRAELDPHRSYRDNVHGPTVLAFACARHGLRLLTFSSDQVFDGASHAPYVEADAVAPLNAYGRQQAAAERNVLEASAQALVVRTSALFGPWDQSNFVTRALAALAAGVPFAAASDLTIAPTYLPDLVHACLDLLIDGETGIWHLTNSESLSWAALARRACSEAGVSPAALQACPLGDLPHVARRPRFSALYSEKEILLPPLGDALARYVRQLRRPDEQDWTGQMSDNK
jgi:dTDP-4-dehydrorhamnose reductase